MARRQEPAYAGLDCPIVVLVPYLPKAAMIQHMLALTLYLQVTPREERRAASILTPRKP
ncbi:hypothetical protein CPter91_5501 [Collimonas pratensis]|uniref:Uncharacterized protein n=1 Tax=Collimonas pratensis TaxID=279113 RepID=A0A127QCN7_9BURK|nr:hypothetical protein CPter91_5501 [Collimonas pratensis]